jgi:hypothetical protein
MRHLRHLALVAALTAALPPATAHAAPQPEVIAYSAGDGIYVSSPPGAAPTKVVAQGYDPAVSADGTWLAWIATAPDDHPHVFVGGVAGGAGVQVTSGPAYDATPAWSPSGTRLAFTRLDKDGNEHIAVVDADGTDERMFATRGSRPTWSPDGRFIAFRGERGLGLESVDADGRGWASLGRDLGQPSWSPDGTQIATVSSNVRMVDVATRSVRSVIHDQDQLPARWFEDVAFNAAGDRLYVRRVDVRDKADATDDIRRYNLDGTEDTTFTALPMNSGYGRSPGRHLSVGGGERPTPMTTTPSPVASLTAYPDPSRVLLNWSMPPANQTGAGATVRYAKGTTAPATVTDGLAGGDSMGGSLLVERLERSTTYTFSVFARDWSGTSSPAVTVTATTPAEVRTTLTLSGPGTITYGQASTLSGQLVREDTGAPIAGARLTLLGHHTGQRDSVLATVTTNADGRFSALRLTSQATRYAVRYAGTGPLLPAVGGTLVLVRQHVTITFSPSSHPPAYSRAYVTATVAPAFPGGNVRVNQISFSGHSLLTKLNSRSQVTVQLDTTRRDATARVQVTPGARTGYLSEPVEAPFQIT